jgi:hypothetical protein
MLRSIKAIFGVISGVFMAAALSVSAQAAGIAVPGSVNYVEGQVSLNGTSLNSKSVGTTEVGKDQLLETRHGKAEILLTPGVFLRVGDNSAVRMLSPELTNTQVEITKGRALLEVTQLLKNNQLVVRDDGAAATIEKNGVYGFNADQPQVQVFDGKATVVDNDTKVELKKGKELNLNGPLKAEKFDRKATEKQDPLYQWSSVRSQYLEQASLNAAQTVVINRGWYGPGWYWDPYWSMYSYLPGTGILYSPFGFGYYSPFGFYGSGFYGYGYPRVYRGYPRGFRRAPGVVGRSSISRGRGGFRR